MEDPTAQTKQSCRSCRRLKRRCSKQLPKCSLCARVGRTCEYPELLPESPRSQSDISHHVSPRTELPRNVGVSRTITALTPSRPNNHSTDQPIDAVKRVKEAAWFLDSVAMRGRHRLLHSTTLDWNQIPESLPQLTSAEAGDIVDKYRATVHTWLPCISTKRIIRSLAVQDMVNAADQTTLLYAMRLMASSSSSVMDGVHSAILTGIEACEANGHCSTDLLASQVLVAFWEFGQGLFPAAYYSVAHATRSCYALGLHDKAKATQRLPKADTWTEVEERRRLWWAVIILDRSIHAGFRFRPLTIPTISPQEIIPADDTAWDEGFMAVNPLLVMSIEAATIVGPYSRLCQAAHLLGGVCQHVNEHSIAEDADLHFQEAHRLSMVILALLRVLDEERMAYSHPQSLFSARAICYSALLLLYDVHSCVEVDEIESCGGNRGLRLDLQQMALDGMEDIASRVCTFAEEVSIHYNQDWSAVTPLILNCIYNAAGVYAWYRRERGNDADLEKLEKLRSVLQYLRGRWNVAESYLWLLEGTENIYEGSCYQ